MTSSDNENHPTNQGKRDVVFKFLPWVSICLILVLHFLYIMSRFTPAITHPDANGYWAQGSLLATRSRTWFVPETDPQYVGVHWLVTESGRYFCRYPPGLPVLVALIYKSFGFKASLLVNPVLGVLSLLGLYLLIRRILHPAWAVVGALGLAINQTFNEHALSCISHIAVTFCLVWGVYFLLRWSERGKLWEVFLAGLFLGCIPTIRYPEALFAIGVGIFLLCHIRSRRRIWLHYLVAIAGAALPLTPLLIRNHFAFGAFYSTGYALTNEQTGFGWSYFKEHFVGYIRNLHGEGLGLFFPLGILGMVALCFAQRLRRVGVLLVTLTVPTTLLYMSYYWGRQGMASGTMRFLLPTFICYIIAGTWALSRMAEGGSIFLKAAIVTAMISLQIVWGGLNDPGRDRGQSFQKKALAVITDALEEHTQHGDVIMANPQILQHLDFVRHWRLVDVTILRQGVGRGRMMRFMNRDGDPDAPMPMQLEKQEIQSKKYSGLSPDDREREIAKDIRKWAGEHKVYYVGSKDEIEQLPGARFNSWSLKTVARVSLPQPPPGPTERRGPGFGGGPAGPGRGPVGFLGGPNGGRRQMFGRRPARFGGMPGRRGGGFRGMGGPMGRRGFLLEAKEVIIAEWTYGLSSKGDGPSANSRKNRAQPSDRREE